MICPRSQRYQIAEKSVKVGTQLYALSPFLNTRHKILCDHEIDFADYNQAKIKTCMSPLPLMFLCFLFLLSLSYLLALPSILSALSTSYRGLLPFSLLIPSIPTDIGEKAGCGGGAEVIMPVADVRSAGVSELEMALPLCHIALSLLLCAKAESLGSPKSFPSPSLSMIFSFNSLLIPPP
jgi:hypothetical protein